MTNAPAPHPPEGAFARACAAAAPADVSAAQLAEEHLGRLTKPPGSLGELERIGVRLAAIAGACPPPIPQPATIAVFAADHGVVEEGVTPWPQEVTTQMVANFLAGGAAINVLARQVGAAVVVVDVGVASELPPSPGLLAHKVRPGTRNLRREDAMTPEEAERALDAGASVASRLAAEGSRCLVTGDMGIGNTTASAAVIAALTGSEPREVTGRGTGIDDATLATKVGVIEDALERLGPRRSPLEVLAAVGGLEIAALAGFVAGAAAARLPVIVDGVIAQAGLLVAAALCPPCLDHAFVGHRSTEPGSAAVLDHLGARPVLDLGLRLGEGTGAALAVPIVQAAARVLGEMATFDQAGVSRKD